VSLDAELDLDLPGQVGLVLPVAGLGARAMAWLVDWLVVFLLWVAGLLLYSMAGDLLRQLQALSFAGQLLALLGVLSAGWAWDVAWEVLWRGQTPGKRALGLRVVRDDGAPVGPLESIVRNALRAVELPLGYAPGVLLIALGRRHQRLGDLAAGTLVVQERRFDLSRYGPPAADEARWGQQARLAARHLAPAEFDRLADFLRRRPELAEAPRGRIASRLAAAFAARAGQAAPAPAEAEGYLEALAFHAAEGS
jgi:uncharacterized RDD family membrane protein YckC